MARVSEVGHWAGLAAICGCGLIVGFIAETFGNRVRGLRLEDEKRKAEFGVRPPSSGRSHIAILGSGGSGRTVCYAMLGKVLGSGDHSDLDIEYTEGLGYLKNIRNSLNSGEWPAKTFVGTSNRFAAIIYEKKLVGVKIHDMIMNDIAGEDFETAFNPENETLRLPATLDHIPNSEAFICILDPSDLKEDVWRYSNMIQELIRINDPGHKGRPKQPVAIVFSKADAYERHVGNPKHFARENLDELQRVLERRVGNPRFFKVSAIGSEKDGKPRLPLAPFGIGEVMEWALNPARAGPGPGPGTGRPAPTRRPLRLRRAGTMRRSRMDPVRRKAGDPHPPRRGGMKGPAGRT